MEVEMDKQIEISRQKRKAFSYLSKFPNYRLTHTGDKVVLEHYDLYGWDGRSLYKTWREIDCIKFYALDISKPIFS